MKPSFESVVAFATGGAATASAVDLRGCRISGATPAALHEYERALASFIGWRRGADTRVTLAVQHAPSFVMAHVLQAYLVLTSRDPRLVRMAHPVLARALKLQTNEREQLHLAAIAAALADDYELAKARLGELLHRYPRDVLALHVAHSFDYLSGDIAHMTGRVAAVLPAWSSDLPGYDAVLAMHAFSLEECGDYARAEQVAHEALSLNAFNARAHHVMAHVFEMTERPGAGLRWMKEHVSHWGVETVVATHCWWHQALFHLANDEVQQALKLYDRRIGADGFVAIADLIDASALLWRVHLRGDDIASRWADLADAWAPFVDDAFCSFNDIHAMLAYVGAEDWDRAQQLEAALSQAAQMSTRYGKLTRQLGLSACRALIAFGRGNNALAITLLASLPQHAHRLGGSHAQRDVLHLTLLHSIERMRRPARQLTSTRVTAGGNRSQTFGFLAYQ